MTNAPQWVPGQSGNKNGRPKGKNGNVRKTKILLEAQNDLKRIKLFYRSILNSDMETLEKEFSVTSVSNANKMEASKALNAISKAEELAEKQRLEEEYLERKAAAQTRSKPTAQGSTFVSTPSVTVFNSSPSVAKAV